MTKQTKLLLGVAILGTAGYFYWKSTQKPKANLVTNFGEPNISGVPFILRSR